MNKLVASAAVFVGSVSSPVFAQTADPAGLSGFRVEGIATYEGNDGKAIGYGIGAGYDAQLGSVVVGVEAEAVRPGDKECEVAVAGTICARTDRDLYVGGRVGAAVAANTLIYAKLGYTNVGIEARFDSPTPGASYKLKYKLDGVRVGAGVQVGLTSNLYIKGEYRYSNYEDDADKHTGAVALGFQF